MVVTSQESRDELNQEYDKQVLEQSLGVWNALNKAVERDVSISNAVMNVHHSSEVEDEFKAVA